jgi:hypothetical protein
MWDFLGCSGSGIPPIIPNLPEGPSGSGSNQPPKNNWGLDEIPDTSDWFNLNNILGGTPGASGISGGGAIPGFEDEYDEIIEDNDPSQRWVNEGAGGLMESIRDRNNEHMNRDGYVRQ